MLSLLLGSAAASAGMLLVSSKNYPGGYALHRLHLLEQPGFGSRGLGRGQRGQRLDPPKRVHIGTLPAMTGVSRFGELGHPWSYSKVRLYITVSTVAGCSARYIWGWFGFLKRASGLSHPL